MIRDKIVVTGLGVLSPNGNSVDEFWANCINGISGINHITYYNPEGHRVTIAGELSNFNPENILDTKEIRKLDPFSIYALTTASEAILMSGLDSDTCNQDRIGVTIGTGIGGIQTLEAQHTLINEKGSRRVSPQFVPKMIANIAGGHIAMKWGLRGPNQTVTSACASATDAIGMAMRAIRSGDADVMITGGTEASITPLCIAGFANMKALSQSCSDPAKASRPFEANRDGFVLGEGSGMIVIESEEHAINRGAEILVELAGYGSTDDAFHITQPAPQGLGAKKAMENAINDARLNLTDIDYINAHGTSTKFNDLNETLAIQNLFKEHSKELKVSSTKSMTGHLLGAAGAIEAIATIKTILKKNIPPTINYETPDPECSLNYVPNKNQKRSVKAALSNTFGFGGHNAVLCFKEYI